jgi:alcohol dehydrogenase
LEAVGHARRAAVALREAGLDVAIFDGVGENPTTEHVAAGVAAARDHQAALLVAVGGGSSMDCAKGINFLVTNGGRMEDYWGTGKATRPMLPSIGVPTTAGTGSEAQSYALISQADTHRKMACGDPKARFRTVLLDPQLLATVPSKVAAVTAYDALSHAVESFVTRRRNPLAQLYAAEAWRLLSGAFEDFLRDRGQPAPRRAMLLGAHLSGAAIEQSMLGAAHACANPLTARFGVVHGAAVALMLPSVVRFNGQDDGVGAWYAELQNGAGNTETLAERLEVLRAAAGLPATLATAGVDPAAIPQLAREAAEQWTAGFNPRAVGVEDFAWLYRSVA